MQRRSLLDISLKNSNLLFKFSLKDSKVIIRNYKGNLHKRFAMFL